MVNPNRLDDLSGLGHLAAVGLVLVTLVAVNRELRARGFWTGEMPEPDLLGMLHHVALGTVADVVGLKGLNRAFVAKGLIAMRRREGVGLTALMDAARLTGPPEPWHLGFLLGPRINAGGRIGRADLGVRLLLEGDVSEAARIAAELDRLNTERRVIEQMAEAQAEAEALASLGLEDKGAVIVTASEGWHPGVVGLVAARLRERFGRPAFAIALDQNGIGTGSGRSMAGSTSATRCGARSPTGLLMKGGGHAMAAGVTLKAERLAAFRAFLEATLGAAVEAARRDDALLIDGAVTAAGATHDLVATVARAGPFGAGNAEPVFALPPHTVAYAEEVGEKHVRVRLKGGRRRDGQCDRLPRRRPEARPGPGAKPRPAGPRRRYAVHRPLAGRGAGAVPARRYRAGLSAGTQRPRGRSRLSSRVGERLAHGADDAARMFARQDDNRRPSRRAVWRPGRPRAAARAAATPQAAANPECVPCRPRMFRLRRGSTGSSAGFRWASALRHSGSSCAPVRPDWDRSCRRARSVRTGSMRSCCHVGPWRSAQTRVN